MSCFFNVPLFVYDVQEEAMPMTDLHYMQFALQLAKETIGQTSPNPSVGAVCVKQGEVLGIGTHLKAGDAHAEVHALQMAGDRAQGADLYVTLEPCSHTGRTGACSDAIIRSGIRRVIVATVDPNERVAGRGIAKLRAAGIEVDVGLCEREANMLNRPFFHYIQTGMPYTTLKAAITLDGRLATSRGDSKWITSAEARHHVHELRHQYDAILVGSGTVLDDNPFLTTRLPQGGKHPIRIILDRRLQTPIDANVVTDGAVQTIIFTTSDRNVAYSSHFVRVERIDPSRPFLRTVLKKLGEEGIMTLFVEGGPSIHASMIEERLAQDAYVFIAPKLIGNGPSLFTSDRAEMNDSTKLQFERVTQVGPDILAYAQFEKEDDSCSQEL